MAVYFVTGALGSGKSLISVAKIQDKLIKGCPVATNIDLKPHNMSAVGKMAKKIMIYRLPDKPTLFDLNAIGRGNKTYDEKLNGLLVLDECGTWLNTRSWNDKSRQPVLDWFLHARKLGWDIIFLVQNISLVDKQAREALAEHVVYCRRLDRFAIPLIGSLLGIIFGAKISAPKIHLGIVKYGDNIQSPVVERWIYRGTDLYDAYDTKQQFSSFYNKGVYCLLPPYSIYGRYQQPLTLSKIMRLTRIYLKRFSKLRLLILGCLLGISMGYFFIHYPQKEILERQVVSQLEINKLKIKSFKLLGDETRILFLMDNKMIESGELIQQGYNIEVISACKMRIYGRGKNALVSC
ncbi:zonular occludens toxin domain-containing protein [Arsenophonus sp.]|uniref:zonular occludens toxin domain-containing protein n=1 Tax=Arsenophonus sp. TaxID=1872640 RepID=UPI00285CE80D|nr:zonular occludens toxin domain-containing protein [Arsenophonus sp.]MDR5617371.1 zonular occludens toxin domain-containing protein [Arsenophonus sp.]MDR5617539.1 zonular occludens toxin domain-containing protein [Arsenophonus sp.]MDR5617789.1 zonular occludens toxin domain-containing protein [Arsenophonus sp.]MDR5617962.1 zonular occludens toxin domain-containing protein [Arsenophonus sp.]